MERAGDAIHFSKIAEAASINRHAAERYSWLDGNPAAGYNYYRIRAVQTDGKSILSKVAMVKTEAAGYEVKVYPNPVTDKQITVQIKGAQGGQYTLILYNDLGQQITKRMVDYSAGESKVIYLDKKIQTGFYHLQINGKNIACRQNIFIE